MHVRQIRLAAAVCKTVTLPGFGGSNPLACTRVVLWFKDLGWRSGHFAALMRQSSHVRIVPPERLRRLQIGRFPIDEVGRGVRCEFESRRSCQSRWCTLGWFGGCSFKALPRGFDSHHRRQDCDSCFVRISEALMLGTMKLEIIAGWLLTYDLDSG